jgi:NAD-dependent SIR2 family protein deacetylase
MGEKLTRQQRRHQERKGRAITADDLRKACGAPERADPTDVAAWGGKLNIYTCDRCRAHIVTRDVDEGVTPFMLPSGKYCPNRCGAEPREWVNMTSSFYRVWDQRMREDFQWYRPKVGESYDPAYRDHVEKGGLILRPAPSPGDQS